MQYKFSIALVMVSTSMVQFIFTDFFFLMTMKRCILPLTVAWLVSVNFPKLISLLKFKSFDVSAEEFTVTVTFIFFVDLALAHALVITKSPT